MRLYMNNSYQIIFYIFWLVRERNICTIIIETIDKLIDLKYNIMVKNLRKRVNSVMKVSPLNFR